MTAKLRIGAAALAAAWLAASLAHADTKTLARSGGWEAFGGTTSKGRPVCGISTSPKDKYFGLKFFSGNGTFTIQISAKEWDITNGSKHAVIMRFDDEQEWSATGSGMHFDDGDPGLEYDIQQADLEIFIREFGHSRQLRISFKNPVMADWTLGLAGVQAVKDEFEACNVKLK